MKEVHHELVMLPFLSVFDNLEYRVDGGTVTLMGQVVNSALKDDAANAVKHIEGVESVERIAFLPARSEGRSVLVLVALSAGTLAAALAVSLWALIAARLVQGLAGAVTGPKDLSQRKGFSRS